MPLMQMDGVNPYQTGQTAPAGCLGILMMKNQRASLDHYRDARWFSVLQPFMSDTYIDVSSQGRIDRLLHHFYNIVSHVFLQIHCLTQHRY